MRAILSSLLRGLAGIALAVLVVAATWSVYVHRQALAAAFAPVASLLSGGEAPAATADGPAPAGGKVAQPPAGKPAAAPR